MYVYMYVYIYININIYVAHTNVLTLLHEPAGLLRDFRHECRGLFNSLIHRSLLPLDVLRLLGAQRNVQRPR